MSCCLSSSGREDEDKYNAKIDEQGHHDHFKDRKIAKLLFLGTGESGKSTLFKQMRAKYGEKWSDDEQKDFLINFIPTICQNILNSCKELVKQSKILSETTMEDTAISEDVSSSATYIEELKSTSTVNDTVAKHINALWTDSGIQKTYQLRNKYQLSDSTSYYMNRIDEIANKNYLPNAQDILRARVRTTGIIEEEFDIGGSVFKVFDVGGQRNERKKWIHCFEGVTALFYVVSLSEYDQSLYEDQGITRIEESMKLFKEVVNSEYFEDKPLVIFFNKRDLLSEKYLSSPLSEYVDDFDSKHDEDLEYIEHYFMEKYKDLVEDDRDITCYFTCATATDTLQKTLASVKELLLKNSLGEAF